ncbi:MAG: hypothetical protein FNP40_12595 [Dehalobacter sp. 4CP]|uniref:hypothetical protein n=1 Tax=Dehalobacter sp. CP TaxID=2594474 RepID=UPI0013C816B7|nr:hypothetical protein [Dehalobacter sp.]NBJ16372.1 hypothetical protein [Dehalobacter sp. 4CP]
MGFWVFFFYFGVFVIIFWLSREKGGKNNLKKLFIIPIVLAVIITLLSVVKIYFIYKIILILIFLVVALLTYWQWGSKIRNFWR